MKKRTGFYSTSGFSFFRCARKVRLLGAVAIAVAAAGCSSSVLEENKGSDQPGANPGQGVTVASCRGVDLSSELLGVRQLREVIACLNGNHTIDAYQRLLERLSDRQLTPLVDLLNAHLMTNGRRFKDLRESFEHLDQHGVLDAMLDRASDLLGENGLVSALIKLSKPAVLKDDGKVDLLVLASLEQIAKDIRSGKGARANLDKGLSAVARISALDSWAEISRGLSVPIELPRPMLKVLAENFFKFAQRKARESKPYLRVPLWGVVDGSLFELTDRYFSGGRKDLYERPKRTSDKKWGRVEAKAAEVAVERIDALDAFFQYLMVENVNTVVPQLNEAFAALNQPISCFSGTKTISNGAMHVLGKIAKYAPERAAYSTAREIAILTKVGADACEFPANIDSSMDAVFKLVSDDQHLHGATFARLLQAMRAADARPIHSQSVLDLGLSTSAQERYLRLLVELLADQGGESSFLQAVVPLFTELAQPARNVIANTFYLSYGIAPQSKDREVLVAILTSLMENREPLRVRDMIVRTVGATKARESVYDVFVDGFLKLSPADFADAFVKAANAISKSDGKPFVRVLAENARKGLLLNDVQPATDILLDVFENADRHSSLVQTVYEVADLPEFADAVELTARMAQDGSLKNLARGIFNIFDGRLKRVAGTPVLAKRIAPLEAISKYRNLSRKSGTQIIRSRVAAVEKSFWPTSDKKMKACQNLNPAVGLLDYSHAEWREELVELAVCANADGQLAAVEDFVELATDPTKPVKNGQSLAEFITRLTSQFKERLSVSEKKALIAVLGEQLDHSGKRARLNELLETLPYYLRSRWCANDSGKCARSDEITFIEAIADLGQAVRDHGVDLKPFTELAARLVGKNYFREALDAAVDAWIDARDGGISVSSKEKPALNAQLVAEIEEKLVDAQKGWLGKNPIPSDYVGPGPAEVYQVANRYWKQVVSDFPHTRYASKKDFFDRVAPMIDSLADPKFGLLEQAATFFYLMDRNPYDAVWWDGWFKRLSSNRTAIHYYYPGTYPGKDNPTVRVINQLDALELVVIEGDFSLKEIGQTTFNAGPIPVGEIALGLLEDIIIDPNENFAIRNLAQLARSGDKIDEWLARLKYELGVFWSFITDQNAKCSGLLIDLSGIRCGELFVDELKRRLFNLRQIVPVLEALTLQQEWVSGPRGKVLRNDVGFLRDVFYSVLMATPKSQQYTYRREHNTLNFIVNLVKSGTLRNIGTSMWSVNSQGEGVSTNLTPVISMLVKVLVFKENGQYRLNANTIEILQTLLRKDGCWVSDPACGSRKLSERFPLLAKIIETGYEWEDEDRRFTKALAYALVEILEKADRASAKNGEFFAVRLSQALRPWLGEVDGVNFLARHWSDSEDLLVDRRLGSFLARVQKHKHYAELISLVSDATTEAGENGAAIAQHTKSVVLTLDGDAKKRGARLANVLAAMSDDTGLNKLQRKTVEPAVQAAVDWLLEEQTIGTKFQTHLSHRLKSGDLEALLDFGAKHKSKLVSVCSQFGERDVVRRIQDFTDEMGELLQNPGGRR
mgnify:CR=1 FL=1